jgi:flavin reductase (DIM6/NTAB) family NADH-FMN oxidoreductase RutF
VTIAEGCDIDADAFRALLRRQACTVTVVTMAGDPPLGFTATSFTSVSLRPPLVSFCVCSSSISGQSIASRDHVLVHILSEKQQTLARTFAAKGVDRFARSDLWRPGPFKLPLLNGVSAWIACRIVDRINAGDHDIVVAQAVVGRQESDGQPLMYYNGDYSAVRTSAANTPVALLGPTSLLVGGLIARFCGLMSPC